MFSSPPRSELIVHVYIANRKILHSGSWEDKRVMFYRRILAFGICAIVMLLCAACRQATAIGEGVVSAERVQLKQSTARVPGYAGELRRGDKVTIIGEQGTMQKVRCEQPKRIEGWLDKRDIVSQDLFS